MSPSLQELADKLGIRLPSSSPEPRAPRKERRKKKEAAAPKTERRRYGGETCKRGHPYGGHTKTQIKNGKEYTVRYCRTCYTDYERQRRNRATGDD